MVVLVSKKLFAIATIEIRDTIYKNKEKELQAMISLKRFGENLKWARQDAGMTQKELASSLYVSQQVVHRWEAGETLPQADKLQDIARILCVSIDDLFDECEDVFQESYMLVDFRPELSLSLKDYPLLTDSEKKICIENAVQKLSIRSREITELKKYLWYCPLPNMDEYTYLSEDEKSQIYSDALERRRKRMLGFWKIVDEIGYEYSINGTGIKEIAQMRELLRTVGRKAAKDFISETGEYFRALKRHKLGVGIFGLRTVEAKLPELFGDLLMLLNGSVIMKTVGGKRIIDEEYMESLASSSPTLREFWPPPDGYTVGNGIDIPNVGTMSIG